VEVSGPVLHTLLLLSRAGKGWCYFLSFPSPLYVLISHMPVLCYLSLSSGNISATLLSFPLEMAEGRVMALSLIKLPRQERRKQERVGHGKAEREGGQRWERGGEERSKGEIEGIERDRASGGRQSSREGARMCVQSEQMALVEAGGCARLQKAAQAPSTTA
jgi:hypothetical protein